MKGEYILMCSEAPMEFAEMYAKLYLETGTIDFAAVADSIIDGLVDAEKEDVNTYNTKVGD